MSKTSRSKSKNFEILYLNLKSEYDLLQKDNDEICKEYESTIEMLTDSVNELQNQRNSMNKKMTLLEKEKEKLQNKNKEKINDIQELNEKNQKLYQEMINIKNKFKEKEHQIIILENDTEHYLKLIRQNEAMIEELNNKLEEALEDNITIQTEFELYKQMMGEKLSRKSDELKEIKNDMFTKNLMIKKLKNKQDKKDNKFIDSKYLDLDGKSTKKKDNEDNKKINTKNKKNQKRQSNTYTRDNNLSITYNNKNDLFTNISINSIKPININCITQYNNSEKHENINNYSLINSAKINPYMREEEKINNSLLISYNNKINSMTSPSSNKIMKLNNNSYYDVSYKKHFINDNQEFQKINKFDLSNIDYNDTTSGLNVFQNINDEINNPDLYDYLLPNLESTGKIFNEKTYNCKDNNKNDKNKKSKPFKDAFVRKVLNSKKVENNINKLFNYNQKSRGNVTDKLNKYNKFGKKKITNNKINILY